MQIKQPNKKQLNVFVAGIALILLLFSWKTYKITNYNFSLILTAATILFLITYLLNRNIMVKFYIVWMRAASIIGIIVTGIIMMLVFYLIFTPIGLFLRLIGKDILKLKRQPKLQTYWIERPPKEFNKSDYERQF